MKATTIKTVWYACIAAILLLPLSSCLKEDVNEAIGTNNPEVSIYTLRNLFKGQPIALEANTLDDANHIRGLVVSNHEGNNFPSNHIAIQSEWRGQLRGILLEVDDVQRYSFGDSLDVWIDGLTLDKKNGVLTLSGLNHNNAYIINRGNSVVARPVSIATLNNQFENYESTYVEITSDLETEPTPGTAIKGSRPIVDTEGNRVNIFTSDAATFADETVAPSATFRGIALKENDQTQLRLLTYADMAYPSGKIYPNWPETFESPDGAKGSYNMPAINNNIGFHTGDWHLFYSIYGETAGRDRIVSGQYAIRMQQNLSHDAYLQMNFDVPEGASKVTFFYGSYWNDRSSTFQLEYSQDQGNTWNVVGEPISDAHTTTESMDSKQAIFLMNIEGPVRFRINKLGLGSSNATISNGRLGIDDFAIFKSY